MHDALGDRIQAWTTLNEPWCSSFLGYSAGSTRPVIQQDPRPRSRGAPPAAGSRARHAELRRRDASLQLGVTLNLTVADPVDPHDPRDLDAARRIDGQLNRLFLDPIFRGSYPADVVDDLAALGLALPVQPGDLEAISAPIDALGVNYYHGDAVSAIPSPGPPSRPPRRLDRRSASPFPVDEGVHWHPRGLPVTAMDWEVQPEGLTRLLQRVHASTPSPRASRSP